MCHVGDRRGSFRYPSRLLKLERGDQTRVVLIETESEVLHGSYITLTHRWSSPRPPCLSISTLQEFKRSIPFDSLPIHFRDAAEVALSLHVNFLWIDCLCIIQDSRKDLLREVSSMKDIYANGILNISATSPESLVSGLLAPRLWCPSPICVKPRSSGVDENFQIKVMHANCLDSMILKAPLSKRGWVIQERLLSPRVVHFTLSRVVWECCGLTATEVYPKGTLECLTAANFPTKEQMSSFASRGEDIHA